VFERLTLIVAAAAWWVPFGSALAVALAAALASYYVTWRMKRADVNRESALRVSDLIDEAEQLAAFSDQRGGAEAPSTVLRLLQRARVRAQPLLGDTELADRFLAAVSYSFELAGWPNVTSHGWHWMGNAIANVREALVPHLTPPKLVGRSKTTDRSFPTSAEFKALPMNDRDGADLLDALVNWRANRA
jgi:hypothetical protein